jgi:hypothetical protein
LFEEKTVYFIFSESMIIPEVADRRTATLIEAANEDHQNGIEPSAQGITDLWMVEIAERTGKVWRGRFHVGFSKENEEPTENDSTLEEVISFSLDTNTGEMRFSPKPAVVLSDGKPLRRS